MINSNASILTPMEQLRKDFTSPNAPANIPDQSKNIQLERLDRGMIDDLPVKPEPDGGSRMGPMDRMTPTSDLGGSGSVGSTPDFGSSFGGGAAG